MRDIDLLAQLSELKTGEKEESTAAVYAQTHCGKISGSNAAKLCSYQPDIASIEQLETEIEELTHKIESSTTGKTKTAEESRAIKQRQLDRSLSDELPEGAVKFCEELAMLRITGYCEASDVDFRSKACAWGVDNEPVAVDALLSVYDHLDLRFTKDSQQFVQLGDYEFVGCTPDGVIYYDDAPTTTLDIKCPFNRRIHGIDNRGIKSFADFKTKYPAYYWQFTLQMLCVGVLSHSFVSFDPRFPAPLRLIRHDFVLVQQDADFMLARIAKSENLIAAIIADLMAV